MCCIVSGRLIHYHYDFYYRCHTPVCPHHIDFVQKTSMHIFCFISSSLEEGRHDIVPNVALSSVTLSGWWTIVLY